jgi:hypothetical protein
LLLYGKVMFEGKFPLAQAAHGFGPDSHGEPDDAGPLREMTWGDLRTRLEATRDLRASLRAVVAERMASFDAHSARHIAGLVENKFDVNPEDLANSKALGCMDDPSADVGPVPGPDIAIDSDPRK